jgi:perosamine synthetase
MESHAVHDRVLGISAQAAWIPYAMPSLFGNEVELVTDALRSTWISGGVYVEEFEREVGRLNASPYAIAVSNGTTALHLAMLGLGVGPGDEVIVPAFTFAAAANMAIAVGAKLVTADVDPHTWCLDPRSVDRVITSRTRAIVAVHLYGNIADMDPLLTIANQANVALIEDAAEATFSRYKGRAAGTIGRVGTLSFHAAKTITTGEGGMVMTADKDLYQRMIVLRNQGLRRGKPYWHDVVGYNFRLTNVQAAIGCAQLRRLDTIRVERLRVQSSYRRLLQDVGCFQEQKFPPEVDPLPWAYSGRLVVEERDLKCVEQSRDEVIAGMKGRGIEVRPGFYALASLPAYRCLEHSNARHLAATVISLPTYPSLSDEMIERICDSLREVIRDTFGKA